MSARLLGLGFACDMGTPQRKLVLLKLIDACDDDGTKIFPAVATIARAAQCSARQVQRELARFVEAGLLTIVSEGGGRGRPREYAMDVALLRQIEEAGWEAATCDRDGPEKGDTESPFPDPQKGDSETERVTGETQKGDKLSHPTPYNPSLDPSRESARARVDGKEGRQAGDDPAKFEDRVKRMAANEVWRGLIGSSTGWTVRQFAALTDAERSDAEERAPVYLAWCRQQGERPVKLGVYLRDRKFADLPARAFEAALAAKKAKPDDYGPAFGPVWGAAIVAMLVEGGREDQVRWLFREASFGRGWRFGERYRALAGRMEAVPVDGPVWGEWRAEFDRRGWPWLPDTGRQAVAYFPAGGPAGLAAFEAAIGERAREAAE